MFRWRAWVLYSISKSGALAHSRVHLPSKRKTSSWHQTLDEGIGLRLRLGQTTTLSRQLARLFLPAIPFLLSLQATAQPPSSTCIRHFSRFPKLHAVKPQAPKGD